MKIYTSVVLFISFLLFAASGGTQDNEPMDDHQLVCQKGKASWYGGTFHGRKTANGETYDMNALTAAHRTLPFGTMVIVMYNDTSVTVRINDRGPFIKGRIIDLSKRAASDLGMITKGVVPVTIWYEQPRR